MGELQWALLIVCVGLVVSLYVLSRRGKRERDADASDAADSDQLDLLSPRSSTGVGAGIDGGFDEFGVGRKRRRGEFHADGDAPDAAADGLEYAQEDPRGRPGLPPMREPPAPSMATLLNPLPGQKPVAPRRGAEPDAPKVAPTMSAPAAKLVALIVAPTEETDLLGPQLHAALVAQGLKFGDGDVYHRSIGGRVVYSVASLLKPGKLIPAQAEDFSTKGLTVVMNLPGPVQSSVALDDMLATTRALASALKSEIFDARRQRVNEEVAAALRAEVADWARAAKTL